MLSVEQGDTNNHFLVFGMTRPGIKPWSPGPLANILFFRQMARAVMLMVFVSENVVR